MKYHEALLIAQDVLEQLRPHCYRCEIAGSIRRKKEEVKDIEIVAIPKPYDIGLLESGIATVVNRWEKVRGTLPCKLTQRKLPQGICVDLFFVNEDNWGYQFALRTGSRDYNKRIILKAIEKRGYTAEGGYLKRNGVIIPVHEEEDLFKRIGITYIPPENRFL